MKKIASRILRIMIIPTISILLLSIFSCFDDPVSSGEKFDLTYTKCKVDLYVLADIHREDQNDGTSSDDTKYEGLNSRYWAEGQWLEDKYFFAAYDSSGYQGTIEVLFKNERLIESIIWKGTFPLSAEGTSTATVRAEEVPISEYEWEPNVYKHTFAIGLADCSTILTVERSSIGQGRTYTWTDISCDSNSWFMVQFEE